MCDEACFSLFAHSYAVSISPSSLASYLHVFGWGGTQPVSLSRNFFTLYQDCINLRIKTHTTKNIINNKLLLWQRGVGSVCGDSVLKPLHSSLLE